MIPVLALASTALCLPLGQSFNLSLPGSEIIIIIMKALPSLRASQSTDMKMCFKQTVTSELCGWGLRFFYLQLGLPTNPASDCVVRWNLSLPLLCPADEIEIKKTHNILHFFVIH